MKTGLQIIAEEQQRVRNVEGFSLDKDAAEYHLEELAAAASVYALPPSKRLLNSYDFPTGWPFSWGRRWWKPSPENRIKELAKAGALIASQIDVILYNNEKENSPITATPGRQG